MPRQNRVFVEGGFYHIFNRLGRGERFFEDVEEAEAFVRILTDAVNRDGLTIYAWCLMANHYHLAVRSGAVSIDRPLKTLQQRVTRRINARNKVFGPLWQGRYRAKLVKDQRYLDQLLIYIHLNPLHAGIVDDPAKYPWSGHCELLGKIKNPIVEVDEVLRVFGTSRRSGRAAYVRRLKGAIGETWVGEEPGRLPWWKLGRPPKGEDEDPEQAVRARREREELGPDWRPVIDAKDFIMTAASALDLEIDLLLSSQRLPIVVRARELLMVLGVERYHLKVNALAPILHKSPSGMSHALSRAIRRRTEDPEFLAELNELDRVVASASLHKSRVRA